MNVLAIDPGPEQSAFVLYDGERPKWFDKIDNALLVSVLDGRRFASPGDVPEMIVIEQIAAMGMAVGEEVFETCFWSGRFAQAWRGKWERVKRHEVKMHLCQNMRAKDANIRQSIIDRYGGKDKAIGRKKSPGPLFGISGDCWSALAVAITFLETRTPTRRAATEP